MPRRAARHTPTQSVARRSRAAVLTVALALPAWVAAASPGDLCIDAARSAAARYEVPESVLIALTLTETARRSGGEVRPWPWAVNDGGKSHWFDTRDEALRFAFDRFKADARNFDVGCFQLNFRWHADAFDSLADMFDPIQNANYAAGFLRSHYTATGDWELAAGRYHSMTEVYAARYRKIFASHRAQLGGRPAVDTASARPDAAQTQGAGRAAGLDALAAAGGMVSTGSLVSLSTEARPLFGQARRLFQ